jgi:hypothetical protein
MKKKTFPIVYDDGWSSYEESNLYVMYEISEDRFFYIQRASYCEGYFENRGFLSLAEAIEIIEDIEKANDSFFG